MTDTVLELVAVRHGYPRGGSSGRGRSRRDVTPVLDAADLRVAAGEIVGVHGPSGSGKSTLLRIAAGLERPLGGVVLAGGMPLWTPGRPRPRPPRPGWAAAVFQDPAGSLDPAWTLERTLTEPFHARLRPPLSRAERRRRVLQALEAVGLGDVPTSTRPARLSGGQQQRIALARCLLAEPALLVADEPTSALDVTNAAGVMHLLRGMADRGAAILLVSHDRAMLGCLADRLVACHGGRIEPSDVLDAAPVTGGAR